MSYGACHIIEFNVINLCILHPASGQAYQTTDLNRCSVKDRFPRSQQKADYGEILAVNNIDFQ